MVEKVKKWGRKHVGSFAILNTFLAFAYFYSLIYILFFLCGTGTATANEWGQSVGSLAGIVGFIASFLMMLREEKL